jgi:hypothetical protein
MVATATTRWRFEQSAARLLPQSLARLGTGKFSECFVIVVCKRVSVPRYRHSREGLAAKSHPRDDFRRAKVRPGRRDRPQHHPPARVSTTDRRGADGVDFGGGVQRDAHSGRNHSSGTPGAHRQRVVPGRSGAYFVLAARQISTLALSDEVRRRRDSLLRQTQRTEGDVQNGGAALRGSRLHMSTLLRQRS